MSNMFYEPLYGMNRNNTFADVFGSPDEFYSYIAGENAIPDLALNKILTKEKSSILFFLLYSKYGNSTFASSDQNRSIIRMLTMIWQYAPNWLKELDVQEKLRNLTESEITEGSENLHNAAYNPSSIGQGTDVDRYLGHTNAQNVTKHTRAKLEGYAVLDSLLKEDVTETFLNRFKVLFLTIAEAELPLWYCTDEETEQIIMEVQE